MSIEVTCGECKQKMVNSVLEHNSGCSANAFAEHQGTDYLRPPTTIIKFSSPEERAEWLKNLNGSSANIKPKRKLARKDS